MSTGAGRDAARVEKGDLHQRLFSVQLIGVARYGSSDDGLNPGGARGDPDPLLSELPPGTE